MNESNFLNKKTLIFVFTSISTGGGLTFLKHLIPISSDFNLKYYSVKPIADEGIVKPYHKANFSDFINKNSILIANSQIALFLCLAFHPFSKVFYITHGYANAYPFISNFRKFLSKLIYNTLQRKISFIACGLDEAHKISELSSWKARVEIIPNAVPFTLEQRVRNRSERERNLLFIGRISEQKGIDLLLDAIIDLPHKINLDIAGPKQSREKKFLKSIEEKVFCANEKGHKVKFIGLIDLYKFSFANYKIVIIPSRFEGFAYLPLELSSFGVPYMISRCDGQKELINGLLEKKYSFKNLCKASLRRNLERIIKKPADEIMVDFNDINKRRLLKYSYENFLRKYKDLFSSET